MNKRFTAVLVAVLALLIAVPAFAWSGGVGVKADCEGATVTASPPNYDGGILKTWKPVQITGTGFFPWGEDTHLEGSVTVKWALKGDITGHIYDYHTESFKWAADKPECYETCDETVEQVGEWSEWREGPNGSEVRSRVILFVDARDQETVCKRVAQIETRNESLEILSDCVGWISTHYIYKNGELFDTEIVAQGTWVLPYSVEKASFTFKDEKYEVNEPAHCRQCEPKVWTWLGFAAGDTCALVDRGYDGTYYAPGVPAQEKNCGSCDQPWVAVGSTWWGGYVDDCNGWYDSDATNLDTYYTYDRFDVEQLENGPLGAGPVCIEGE